VAVDPRAEVVRLIAGYIQAGRFTGTPSDAALAEAMLDDPLVLTALRGLLHPPEGREGTLAERLGLSDEQLKRAVGVRLRAGVSVDPEYVAELEAKYAYALQRIHDLEDESPEGREGLTITNRSELEHLLWAMPSRTKCPKCLSLQERLRAAQDTEGGGGPRRDTPEEWLDDYSELLDNDEAGQARPGDCVPSPDVDALREALSELVRLKDGPRDDAYRRDKDAAWERARRLV
jgi:hypothetical protein